MISQAVMGFREEYRKAYIPKYYSGVLHFCFTSVTALGVIVWAAIHLKNVTGFEWITVPVTFLFANFIEYRGHKGPMHHATGWGRLLYQRHTLQHHRFFTHAAMAYESPRDFKMVLFPPVMIIFFIVLHTLPVAVVLYWLAAANVAGLFVMVGIGYFLTYEWLHFSYHLPEDTWIGRLPFMKRLRRLHTDHHNPALMNQYNFNITFPICDALFGTRYKKS